jgi:N-acetylglucosamine-6-phosphate deacetylase
VIKALNNVRIFDGDTILNGKAVLVDDGLVVEIIDASNIPQSCETTNLDNDLLVPGFIDVQVNGGGGVMIDGNITSDGLATIARTHRRFGTTAMLPTLITDDLAAMTKTTEAVRAAITNKTPGIIGIHFEGPLLNIKRKGIHNQDRIRPVDDDLIALYQADGLGVRLVTLAPETVPAGTIATLTKSGIRVCAGHTAGTYDDMLAALAEGLVGFTHLFNAMTPMESRAPGVVGAALEDDNTWCGLIIDGYHIHDAALRTAIRAKANGKMMLITDAMPSVGSDLREFDLYGRTITVAADRCMADDGTLAGSHLDMATAVRNTVARIGLPLEEALRMASLYPAEFLGLDKDRGRITAGYRADFALLDDDLHVRKTWIEGNDT